MRRILYRFNNMSLGKKIAATLSVTIALGGILLSGLGTERLNSLLVDQKVNSSGQIANALASSILPDMLTNDFVDMQDSTDGVMKRDDRQEIVYTGVYDVQGKLLVHSARQGGGEPPVTDSNTIKTSVPLAINGRNFGRVDMYVSLDRVKSNVLAVVLSFAGVLLMVIVASAVAMAFVGMRTIVRPVRKLAASARQISEGNLDLKIPVKSRDELGELSQDFNRMAQSLKDRQAELQVAYEKLGRNYKAIRETCKELRELDHMKSDFIAVASHELKTPLSLIKGYIETMSAGKLGEVNTRQQEKLAVVMGSVERLAEIVDKSLDFSIIERGRFIVEREDLQLAKILEAVLDEFAQEASDRKIHLKKDFPDELPHILGDEVRLHQLFHNLVANAVDFTTTGGVVTVHAFFDAKKRRVITEIADTGSGIPEEELKYLFTPFFQVESPTIRSHPGVGLGLAIAKGIVEGHDGTITVDSRVGEGSVFTIAFPVPAEARLTASA